MKKKLIKRIEELAVENERLSNENSELRKRLRKHEPRIVGYEWFGGGIKPGKCSLINEENKVFNELDKDEERPKTTSTYEELGSQDFKRGDVLIREWLNGRVDYCRFKEFIKDNECLQNHFYDDGYFYSIYENGKWNNFSDLENVAVNCSDIETLKFNWRKATQKEIEELNKLLGKEEPKEEEVWWLCKKSMGYYFTKDKKYKQISCNENTITFINNLGSEHNVYKDGLVGWFTKVGENKELEEAKEILKDWRFGKCTYSSDEIDRAIETILKHFN